MDAIVTAGGVPQPGDPLYEYSQGKSKALIDIAGKPMAQWVLDALTASKEVEDIVLIGVDQGSGLSSPKIRVYLPNQGHMVQNILAGLIKLIDLKPDTGHALIVSSDIPAITADMVDWVVREAMRTNDDIYYNVIPRSVMETRFPNSRRSYTRLKDAEVCGGDMNVARASLAQSDAEIWDKLVESRKNVFKQASLIGFDTLLLLLLRQITIDKAVGKVARKLKLSGRAIVCPYAEVGMDIDKPHQLEMMRADLAQRQGQQPEAGGAA